MKKSEKITNKQFILLFCFLLLLVSNPAYAAPIDYDYKPQRTDQTKYVDKYFEVDENGDYKIHIFLGDEEIATVDNRENIVYPITDHLGSPTIITNQEANIVETNDYESYGQLKNTNSSIDNNYKFTGKELDKESNLQYYGQRYYDNSLGKFMSVDPILINSPQEYLSDPQQLNSYAYARNNPVRFIDPSGGKNQEFQPYLSSSVGDYIAGEPLASYRDLTISSRGSEGIYTTPYQCVNLAKNFAQSQYGVNLDYTGHAYAYGDQSALDASFSANNPNNSGRYIAYSNKGNVMPQENDIISWTNKGVGHVGFISEVTFDDASGEGYVYSIEQNYSRNGAIFYQNFTRSYDSNGQAVYKVEGRDDYTVRGWARYENQSLLNSPNNYTSIPYTPATQSPIEYEF